MTDYDPNCFTLNGRVYPQTILPNDDPSLPRQPHLLVDASVNAGDRGRTAAARQPRLPAARDAAARHPHEGGRRGRDAAAQSERRGHLYVTETLYIGPGEARDVLFTAPAFNAVGADDDRRQRRTTTRYVFKNRNVARLDATTAPLAPAEW